jgi:hypothetical protein
MLVAALDMALIGNKVTALDADGEPTSASGPGALAPC